jgi:cysteine desulfuration protein SufE
MSRLSLIGTARISAVMTDAANPIEETLADLIEDFEVLEDWEQRIAYVIDLGKDLSPLPDADRIEANKVPGCAAQVWLATGRDGDLLTFRADSDSAISKGNVALLLRLYSGRAPADILAFDAKGERSQRHGRPHPGPGDGGGVVAWASSSVPREGRRTARPWLSDPR